MQALPSRAQLYVYYRVVPAQADTAIGAVKALHATLAAEHRGLSCNVFARAAAGTAAVTDGLTLMEVYTKPGGIDAGLAAHIEQAAQARLGAWLIGARHTEVFVPCA